MASKSFEKLIEEIGNMSVTGTCRFSKSFRRKFGVSAAMPMAAAAQLLQLQLQKQQEEKIYIQS